MNSTSDKSDMALFWGCFIALITTSYAFISRMILCGGDFISDFGLDKVAVGELQGAGIWPFGVSIIIFSLFIDKIGYKTAMVFSFISYLAYTALAIMAYGAIQGVEGDALVAAQAKGYKLLTWGSIILGLGNGAVEAYINPVVATIFRKDKVKWLNILHAGWPAGLVLGGLCTIALASNADWRITLGLILVPAIIFFFMLIGAKFPKSEREQAGVGYVDMLKELGIFGAFVGFGLVVAELGRVFAWPQTLSWALTLLIVGAFAVITKSFGRIILAILIIIMMPLATAEIGTDGWISSLMEGPMKAAGHHPAWVLVYTSAIMMVLRFFAGSIVSRISPLGLLAGSAVLAIIGLSSLAAATSLVAIFIAATVYAFGKTFFWPTTLAVVSEQTPKGGALTLNAIGGIGMLAVGILGGPVIGAITEQTAETAIVQQTNAETYAKVSKDGSYVLGSYKAIDAEKVATLAKTDKATAEKITAAREGANQGALAKIAMFPMFMLACYIGLILWFRSRGGYKAEVIGAGGH